ncbi:MAG: hypothetical protein RL268_277 [Pseudomonadota bacterium]
MVFAQDQFELDKVVEGITVREHLQAISEKRGELHPRLAVACPAPGVWRAFRELRSSTPVGMALGRIPFSEIDAYQRVTGRRLDAWGVDAIRQIDAAFVAGARK